MTWLEKMSSILIALGLAHAFVGIFNIRKFFSDARSSPLNPPLKEWPGISILVPVKGPVAEFDETVGALFDQDYAGPFEIIFAFQDAGDVSLSAARQLTEQKKLTSKAEITILAGLPFLGLNPKNSNLVYAYREAKHPWLYVCDVDTCVPKNMLRAAMQRLSADPNQVATAITVHENPRDFGACLEVIGTNLELPSYFVTMFNLKSPRQPLSGAAQLMSRELFEKVDGPQGILNQVTDDVFLEGAYFKQKAKVVLLPLLVRVQVPNQTLKGFVQRQVRWMSVFRCYKPKLYWLAPLFWYPQWLLLIGGLARSGFILAGSALIFCARILQSYIYQVELKAPRPDRFKAPLLLVYDLLVPFLWVSGLFKTRIEWAGVALTVQRNGQLVREPGS